MLITINTDGSYLPIHRCGGYAFWISCEEGRFLKWGALFDCKSSMQAELMTLANALYYVRKNKRINKNKIRKFIINCDMHPMERYLDIVKPPPSIKRNPKLRELVHYIVDKIGETPVEYRHVKGHSRVAGQDKRSYVNKWCDTHAKKGAKQCFKK